MNKARYTGEIVTDIVLIHGWGISSAIWQQWLPELRQQYKVTLLDLPGYGVNQSRGYINISAEINVELTPEQFIVDSLALLPKKAVYIGFSLGGMLASKVAELYPDRVQALVSISSNLKFVADETYSAGMDAHVFKMFSEWVNKSPQSGLKRFLGLQAKGDGDEKKTLRLLREIFSNDEVKDAALCSSLKWLEAIDNRKQELMFSMPMLKLFSENDVLVPISVAEKYQAQSNIQVEVVKLVSHAALLSQPSIYLRYLDEFLRKNNLSPSIQNENNRLQKTNIARSFSKAASTYDQVASLQRSVGEKLLTQLPPTSLSTVVDLGCGTGYFSSSLSATASDQFIGVDLAEGMVRFAKQHYPSCGLWVCGDGENIPLPNNSVDLVFSSLSIQWSEDLNKLFSEVYRVLKAGGTFLFTTFGPETLKELKHAWSAVDDYVHVNQFAEKKYLLSELEQVNFTVQSFTEDMIISRYASLKALTNELKGLGAHNVNLGRPEGLTGKNKMKKFINAYGELKDSKGMLPASYQIWYGEVKKHEA